MDKIDRFLDALEHPERYSSAEIETMLHDPAIKEVSDLLDKTKSSLQKIETPDIEAEWNRFENRHNCESRHERGRLLRISFRNAAASIAIAVASFTALAAVVGAGLHYIHKSNSDQRDSIKVEVAAEAAAQQRDTLKVIETSGKHAAQMVVFNDETLESIITKIAAYHDCKVVFNKDASRSIRLYFRWDRGSELEDVIERLNNFQQIHVTVDDKTIKVD